MRLGSPLPLFVCSHWAARLRVGGLGKLLPIAVLLLALPGTVAGAASEATADPALEELAALIARLGDADYGERESAARQLNALGPAAVDALLAATEMSNDLEVALRARWIVDGIPLNAPHDSAEVVKLLHNFKRKDFGDRLQVMHRLLRVDDDAGIEALARVVRLDRSTSGSRVAAALLAREWQADNPYWAGMCAPITAGLGGCSRPAAQMLKALVAFSQTNSQTSKDESLVAASEALRILHRRSHENLHSSEDVSVGEDAFGSLNETTFEIFERCHVRMLLAAGQRAQAAEIVDRMLADYLEDRNAETTPTEIADLLVWAVENGIATGVDSLQSTAPELIASHSLIGYAAALCQRAQQNEPQAQTLATAALENDGTDFAARLKAAMLLAKWGAVEWANREYLAVLDNPQTPPSQFALAALFFSEFLHDQQRDDEAAESLQRLIGGAHHKKRGGDNVPILQQLGRDPRSIASRMHYFQSCAARDRGDTIAQRKSLDESLRSYPKDVDSLIALYKMPDNTPQQQDRAVVRVNNSLLQIDSEIQAVPDDTIGYNEYAWLVANTQGDIAKATRYSKLSLIKSFDSASYLDTLAHCRAAAGDYAAAIRFQRLAKRHEPHNRTIDHNLEQFQKKALAVSASRSQKDGLKE